ncbi:MAG: ATP synthase subunit I [Neisseria sp.]|nr:ATP synthase subunit I [Neisseria sp.]
MLKIILLQVLLSAAAVVLCGLFAGGRAAYSASAGALCYLIPSIITALVLNFFRRYPELAGYGFIFGEGLRIVLALALMVGVFVLYAQSLMFLPFLIGLLAASHVFFIVFWKVKPYGK